MDYQHYCAAQDAGYQPLCEYEYQDVLPDPHRICESHEERHRLDVSRERAKPVHARAVPEVYAVQRSHDEQKAHCHRQIFRERSPRPTVRERQDITVDTGIVLSRDEKTGNKHYAQEDEQIRVAEAQRRIYSLLRVILYVKIRFCQLAVVLRSFDHVAVGECVGVVEYGDSGIFFDLCLGVGKELLVACDCRELRTYHRQIIEFRLICGRVQLVGVVLVNVAVPVEQITEDVLFLCHMCSPAHIPVDSIQI